MIFHRLIPDLPLREFVDWLWYYDDLNPAHRREHVLPDGTFELVIDLREEPRKWFNRQDPNRYSCFRRGWLSGTHSQYIVIDALPNSSMIGVHFRPGGASPFLGCPAEELRDQVVEMDAVWGAEAPNLREKLLAAARPQTKFRLLEQFLLKRLKMNRIALDRRSRITWAIDQLIHGADLARMGAIADQLGVSHKHFIEEFRREVGLTPKLFCRIQRFQRVLTQARSGVQIDWADVACRCGYFDQSHFVHDFQGFAGLNPTGFLERRLEDPNYVPVS